MVSEFNGDVAPHINRIKDINAFIVKLKAGSYCVQSGNSTICYKIAEYPSTIGRHAIRTVDGLLLITSKHHNTSTIEEICRSLSDPREYGIVKN